MSRLAGVFSGVFLLLALYCGLDPFKHSAISGIKDFKVYRVDAAPWSKIPVEKDTQNLLQKSGIMPLGLRFDKRTGDLYIADAYFGLMKVGLEGGLEETLTTEAEGVPLVFTNDLYIDDEGNAYFTDSSTKYQRRNLVQLVYSVEDSGRCKGQVIEVGEKTGTSKVMAVLPGYPDKSDQMKELPIPIKLRSLLYLRGQLQAIVVKYSAE
ncbi:hypothetical protein HAX54_048263, partial [Datura stramonium]|nr:hypothetical protein [Datura stramonium]